MILKEELARREQILTDNRIKMGISIESIKAESFNKGLRFAIDCLERNSVPSVSD
jgi:hypothetical protein